MRINVLSALKNGLAEVTVYAESDGRDIPYAELCPGDAATFRYNNFSVSETPEDDSIVFCPVVVGCLSIISVSVARPGAADFSVNLIRKGADSDEEIIAWTGGYGERLLFNNLVTPPQGVSIPRWG